MKIVNKRKFLKSNIILFFIITILIGVICNFCYSDTPVKYKEIYLDQGETIWSIAENEVDNIYFKSKDIRDIVSELKNINNLETANVKAGEKIKIPYL